MARNLFADEPIQESTGVNLFADQPVPRPDQSQGFVPQPFDVKEQSEEEINPITGTAKSLGSGLLLGFDDELQAGVAALVASPFISDKTIGQIYADARKSFREEKEQFKEESPILSAGGEIAGSLLTGGAGVAKTAVAKTLPAAIAKGTASAGAVGAVAGAGFSDQEDFFSAETLRDAATTGGLSAFLGGLTPVAIRTAIQAGRLVPKALPESLLQTALKFRPSIDQVSRAKMTRTALDEGIMPTIKGLETISKKLTNLDVGLNKIIDDATTKGILIPKKALFTELKKLRKDLGGINIRGSKNIKQIDNIAGEFDKQLKSIDKTRLTPREVQDLKRSAYQQLKFDVSQQSASFAETEAEKGIIRGARQSLEVIDPDVQKINRREGNLLQFGEELERVVSRLDNRNLISLDTAVKITAGTATGTAAGTAIGTGAAVLGAPRVKARMALLLENLRKLTEISETVNKNLPDALLAPMSVIIDQTKEDLSEIINE